MGGRCYKKRRDEAHGGDPPGALAVVRDPELVARRPGEVEVPAARDGEVRPVRVALDRVDGPAEVPARRSEISISFISLLSDTRALPRR